MSLSLKLTVGLKGCDSNFEVNIFYEKIMSVKLLAIVIIDFKRYPSTYCLMQGGCSICSVFLNLNILPQN